MMNVTNGLLVLEHLGLATEEEVQAIKKAARRSEELQDLRVTLRGKHVSDEISDGSDSLFAEFAACVVNDAKEDENPVVTMYRDLHEILTPGDYSTSWNLQTEASLLWNEKPPIAHDRLLAAAKVLARRELELLPKKLAYEREPATSQLRDQLKDFRKKWA